MVDNFCEYNLNLNVKYMKNFDTREKYVPFERSCHRIM